MTGKPVILFDIDEVIYPFAHSYHYWLIKEHGLTLNYEKANHYDELFATEWHTELSEAYLNTEHGMSIPPLPRGEKILHMLKEDYHIALCTGRVEEVHGESTKDWVERWLPFISDIHYFRKAREDMQHTSKAPIVEQMQAVAIFDDYAPYIQNIPDYCTPYLIQRVPGLPSDEGALTWEEALQHFCPISIKSDILFL